MKYFTQHIGDVHDAQLKRKKRQRNEGKEKKNQIFDEKSQSDKAQSTQPH